MNKIDMTREILNKDRKFGSQERYIPVVVYTRNGERLPALLTNDQVVTAIMRAASNPEDAPTVPLSWTQKLLRWLR
ncbi:MAG: hypothetical protein ACOH2T_19260 [Pseudomonas sp.]